MLVVVVVVVVVAAAIIRPMEIGKKAQSVFHFSFSSIHLDRKRQVTCDNVLFIFSCQ